LPHYLTYKQLFLVNLIFLDICCTYKTYRHIFGLPVNGQRTWSNANNSYTTNIILRQYKLKKFSNFLVNSKPFEFKKIFLAEYVNFFWKKQFFLEWLSVKKKRLLFLQNNYYITYKVDFDSMVKGRIDHFFLKILNLKKKKSHRKKKNFLKNTFNTGWDFGFSKFYIDNVRKIEYLKAKKK